MSESKPDRIHIRDLRLRCIIGVRDWERRQKQEVHLNITLHADLNEACRSDDLDDTVDYVRVKKRVIRGVEDSSFFLVERLAERVARLCLEEPRVRRVCVAVEKPGALRFARTVCVEIVRDKSVSQPESDD
jgi:FolB domain-containing protein